MKGVAVLFLIERFLFKVKPGLQYKSTLRSMKQPLAELAFSFIYRNTLYCYINAVLRMLTWLQGLYLSTVLLPSKITTVTKDFRLKIEF